MNVHSNFVRLRTRTRALRDMSTMPLRAVVATHVSVAVAPPPEGTTPAVATSSPLIGAVAVAPAPLGTAPVLRVLTPVVRVVVVVLWEAGLRLAGPRALKSSSPVSSKGPVEKGGACSCGDLDGKMRGFGSGSSPIQIPT